MTSPVTTSVKRRSLERTLVAAVLLVSGAVALVATGVQVWAEYRQDAHDVQVGLRELAETYVSSVGEAVWVGDLDLLSASLRGLAGLPDVVGVEVTEGTESLARFGSVVDGAVEHVFPLARVHRGEPVPLGRLVVYASLDNALARLRERVAVILATNFAKTLFVSIIMVGVFRRLVTRHLLRIAAHARAFEVGGEARPLRFDPREGLPADELAQVAGALNGLEARARAHVERQHALRAELEASVAELKAADLRGRRLHRQLDAQVKELERFGYSLSHDLRQSLRTIASFSDLLLEDLHETAEPESVEMLRRIAGASARMDQTVDAMLALHRLSSRELHRSAVDVSALAWGIAGDLGATDPDRTVRWVIPEDLTVNADAGLLQLALQNLMGNAFKFSAGRAPVRIEVFAEALGDGRSAICVRDNGPGFDMAHATRIFEPFQRLHAEGAFQGTGVGLATVERVVSRHGGEVWADANPDAGAVFRFTLEPPAHDASTEG